MTPTIKEQLSILIRARYPIMWIETHEERRAVHILNEIATKPADSKEFKVLWVWSSTSGICTVDGKQASENTSDPQDALEAIHTVKQPVLAVFKDLHRYIEHDMVCRKLRDLHEYLKDTQKSIVILAPIVRIPIELQKSVTVVSLPLPGKDDLDEILESVLNGLEDMGRQGNEKAQETLQTLQEWLEVNGNRETLLSAGLGLTLDEFEDVLTKSIAMTHSLDTEVIVAEKEQIIRKSGILEFYTSLAEMQDVGGLQVLKDWITKRRLAFSNKAREFGLKTPKGVFLAGAPGTGKSLTAKVLAKYMQMPLLRLDVSRIFASHVGESEQNISSALKIAEAVAPSILFIDEVEKALAGVQSSGQLDSGVTARVFGTMLTWMQDHEAPVFVVATSNNPIALPPEFMRAGRFDEVFYVDLPSEDERMEIFEIHLRKVHRNPEDFDVTYFARASDGFSGAEIEAAIQDALHKAFFAQKEVTNEDISEAVLKLIPLSKKRKGEIDALRKWGEANAVNASIPKEALGEKRRQIAL